MRYVTPAAANCVRVSGDTVLTDETLPDPLLLPAIGRELARRDLHPRFKDSRLNQRYEAERQAGARLHNRIAMPIYVLIFDLFVLAEVRAVPEILMLSIFLRFILLTPAAVLFVVLDWRGWFGRWLGAAVTALAIAPTVAAAIEIAFTTSPAALPNIQDVPLALLIVLACCFSLKQAAIVTCCSVLVFVATVCMAPVVPSTLVITMVLTDIAIGTAALAFAWRIDSRDRRVFLFGLKAQIESKMLADRNGELSLLSHSDALTGLGNRRHFNETLAAAWQSRAPVALIMFDIDHFKRFNDSFGHREGDACLQAVAEAVAQCIRDPADTLARYGGEEFALILPSAGLEGARLVAERMREAVVARCVPHPCVGPPGCVTISLGVASMVPGEGPMDALIEAADRCLYTAKRRGRNRVETEYRPEPDMPAYIKLVGTQGMS
jgi:diguanylate cyclase (GGDEF)-like protein